jgi:hypothetical protein
VVLVTAVVRLARKHPRNARQRSKLPSPCSVLRQQALMTWTTTFRFKGALRQPAIGS